MPASLLLEIACFNAGSAMIAQNAGADRIELCDNYLVGGITPPNTTISEVKKNTSIPLHVIIRPRGGNFVYSQEEIVNMKNAVAFCREQGINGIVFGALTPDNKIDLNVCKDLISDAGSMSFTFHRAIDACLDLNLAMEQLIDLGIHRVLMSASDNAMNGISALMQLQQAYGNRITIMPGGGIRSSNISEIMKTGCTEFHSAAITKQPETADAGEIKKLKQALRPK